MSVIQFFVSDDVIMPENIGYEGKGIDIWVFTLIFFYLGRRG